VLAIWLVVVPTMRQAALPRRMNLMATMLDPKIFFSWPTVLLGPNESLMSQEKCYSIGEADEGDGYRGTCCSAMSSWMDSDVCATARRMSTCNYEKIDLISIDLLDSIYIL